MLLVYTLCLSSLNTGFDTTSCRTYEEPVSSLQQCETAERVLEIEKLLYNIENSDTTHMELDTACFMSSK